jgi:hypothetical protein
MSSMTETREHRNHPIEVVSELANKTQVNTCRIGPLDPSFATEDCPSCPRTLSRERFCHQVGQGWFATMRTPTGQSARRGVGDAGLTWGPVSVRLRAARWGQPELVRRVSGAPDPAASCGRSRLPSWVFNEGP